MSIVLAAVGLVLGLLVGGAFVYFYARERLSAKAGATGADIDKMLAVAQAQQKELILEAKDEAHQIRSSAEQDARERRAEVQRLENRIQQKEENLEHRAEQLERREHKLTQREQEIEDHAVKVDELIAEQRVALERVSGLTQEEAETRLLASIESEVRDRANQMVRQIESEAKEEADERARKIITTAIIRWASDQVSESSVAVVPLPGEEMKGRIIGREGRNIRALEDGDRNRSDHRRHTRGRHSLRLRSGAARDGAACAQQADPDGRIHPARIEEMVAKARTEVEHDHQRRG